MKIKILYEDNQILVAEKPSGILSQKDGSHHEDMLTLLKKYIKEKYQKPGNVYLGLVHRLDQPTTGVMVFAKTSKAASRLSQQMKDQLFIKKYYLLCHGSFREKEGTWIDSLEKRGENVVVTSTGKKAELSYRVLDYKKEIDCSFVEVTLKTGRKHQIRVQFASRSHPLFGDNRYGKCEQMDLCLCAYSLSFLHPVTKERLNFIIQPPLKGLWTLFTM